jgi:hypothetical protein
LVTATVFAGATGAGFFAELDCFAAGGCFAGAFGAALARAGALAVAGCFAAPAGDFTPAVFAPVFPAPVFLAAAFLASAFFAAAVFPGAAAALAFLRAGAGAGGDAAFLADPPRPGLALAIGDILIKRLG